MVSFRNASSGQNSQDIAVNEEYALALIRVVFLTLMLNLYE